MDHDPTSSAAPSTSSRGSAPEAGLRIDEVGEFGLVNRLLQRLPQGDGVLLGPGDDAAELAAPSGRTLVSTDVLVEGRHFRRDWASAEDIGRRAAGQSLSDINAMGGRATALTLGLAVPPTLEVAWVLSLADGLVAEAAEVGASVVGGDITRSDVVVISVTALGEVDGAPVLRSGARPGDQVAVCGRLGWAAAGLAVLARGFRSPRATVEAYRRPLIEYDAGPQARALGATAMVDVSDGLVADLGHLCAASGVLVDVSSAAFAVPEALQAVGAALGVDPLSFVLSGGDDHALVATFPADVALPDSWTVIGAVAEGSGVTVDGAEPDGPGGFQHF